MRPGSSDGLMTVLSSVVMAVLLFLAREIVDARRSAEARQEQASANTSAPESTDAGPPAVPETRSWTDPPARTEPATTAAIPPPATDTYKVVGIIDGDTIDVLVNLQPLRLRLNGVDTPEKGQPFGSAAKEGLSRLIGSRPVSYVVRDTDRYDRSIADVYVDGTHVNEWLIRQGLRWHYEAYSDDAVLAAAQSEAKAAGRGLWSDSRAVAPWNWRKLSKADRDTYR